MSYERDCKSYPDYSYDYNHRLPSYYDYNSYEPTTAQQQQQQLRTPPPRVPQMGVSASGHRRTPSTVSNSSTNYNQSFGGYETEPAEYGGYDYNNLNLGGVAKQADYYVGGANPGSPRDQRIWSNRAVISPTPATQTTLTKHEIYSPKLLNRLQQRSNELNRSKSNDYENLPLVYDRNAAIKQVYGSNTCNSQQRPLIYGTPTHSTPMSPIHKALPPPERPASLPFEKSYAGNANSTASSANSKLRSSLKKYNYGKANNGGGSIATTVSNGILVSGNSISQQGTPTNPTPPGSLTSDDSSYLSAKEGSISSQHSRVRFSPESFLDATANASSPAGNSGALMGATQTHDYMQRALKSHRVSRRHTSDTASSPSS